MEFYSTGTLSKSIARCIMETKKTEQFQFFPSANFIPTSYRIPKSFIVYVLLFFYYNDKIPKKSKWHN